jgi:hypothetical protein
MIYRGQGFLAVKWFGSSPPPSPSPVSKMSLFLIFLCVAGRDNLRERMGGGGRGARSYDREKAWPSTNNSILSGAYCRRYHRFKKPCSLPCLGLLRISNLLRLNILNYFTFQAALENRSYTDLHRLHLILRQAEIVTLSTKYFWNNEALHITRIVDTRVQHKSSNFTCGKVKNIWIIGQATI